MQFPTMKADPKTLEELIRKQPPPSSERFWEQVEKAKASSPNSAPLLSGPIEKKIISNSHHELTNFSILGNPVPFDLIPVRLWLFPNILHSTQLSAFRFRVSAYSSQLSSFQSLVFSARLRAISIFNAWPLLHDFPIFNQAIQWFRHNKITEILEWAFLLVPKFNI